MFQCQLCSGVASAELKALCGRVVCIACATAISDAMPRLKTQPSRRHAICMRLQENGVRVMAASQQVKDLAEWGVTDEQITGACDIAKERNGFAAFGYVYGILKNERERQIKKPVPVAEEVKPEPVKAKEEWERQGFASQADYDACDHAYNMARFKQARLSWVDFRRNWISEAV